MPKTLVVNMFAGPGSGKSTLAAAVFAQLKSEGVNCEMALEFAKEKVWEESFKVLSNQIYVFGKQHHTLHRLQGKVDVIITDSPLLLSLHYAKDASPAFKQLVLEEHQKHDSLNFFVKRIKAYNPAGRNQNLTEAKAIDRALTALLRDSKVQCIEVPGTLAAVPEIVGLIQGWRNVCQNGS